MTPYYEPYSDVCISDKETIDKFNTLVNQNDFVKAKEVVELNAALSGKGMRASFFNALNSKIRDFQVYLLNLKASPDELYSLTEPSPEQMQGKKFWIKPIIEEGRE